MSIGNPLQHTDEWHLARRGRITSSRMRRVTHGTAKGWLSFMNQLRDELASPVPLEKDLSFVPAIAHGYEYEPAARAAAEMLLDEELELVGFQVGRVPYIGCSSDSLAYARTRNVEIKCPLNRENHLAVYNSRRMPDQHVAQVQTQMFVWDVEKTLFVSYHPDMPHWKMQAVIVEVPRDDSYIATMLSRCAQFMDEFNGARRLPAGTKRIPRLF